MYAFMLTTAAGVAALLWLILLIATDFNGLVIGAGLLGGLVAVDYSSPTDTHGQSHRH
ncbi:MAG TPA: hypothetical protein VF898_04110 [Chloroflexota bacterium]